MKKLIIALMLIAGVAFAQDATKTMTNNIVRDTLTATKDTVIYKLPGTHQYYSIYAVSTGTDTLTVQVYNKSAQTWIAKAVKNMATDAVVSGNLVITTAPVEYLLIDYDIEQVRLIVPDAAANIKVYFLGKRYLK